VRRNQAQENAQMQEWSSKEDEFVLKQSKKKAQIRVREGRAKPIDWLAVILSIIDPTKDLLHDESADAELEIMDPIAVVEDLPEEDLRGLEKEIDHFHVLETNRANLAYWEAMKTICKDRNDRIRLAGPSGRGISSVSADIDQLLSSKSLEQLTDLQSQIRIKLRSNEPIDVEYWERLLGNVIVYKAKAELKKIYQSVLDSRIASFKAQQLADADAAKQCLSNMVGSDTQLKPPSHSLEIDPEPLLKNPVENKGLEVIEEAVFLARLKAERQKVIKLGYVPMPKSKLEKSAPSAVAISTSAADNSSSTSALYDREVARGIQEDEEIFAGEEEVSTATKAQWSGKYRPRKPRYFNRVQLGYEWNKYNQTHYDHDNPPPKVVQGYKFNIFYPDLIDTMKAPTYRIERENGRKRGQSFAQAGEEDTCLIRFMSGPPYEDIAFRIVDKEWDYSAKRERGFRSSFDKVSHARIPPLGFFTHKILGNSSTSFSVQKGG
jgi:hypothetical protein